MSGNNFNITVFRRKCREVIFRKRKVWKKYRIEERRRTSLRNLVDMLILWEGSGRKLFIKNNKLERPITWDKL